MWRHKRVPDYVLLKTSGFDVRICRGKYALSKASTSAYKSTQDTNKQEALLFMKMLNGSKWHFIYRISIITRSHISDMVIYIFVLKLGHVHSVKAVKMANSHIILSGLGYYIRLFLLYTHILFWTTNWIIYDGPHLCKIYILNLGFTAGMFQALQLVLRVAFGTVDEPLESCRNAHF